MNQVLREVKFEDGRVMHVVQGDLTLEKVDAIVNAANSNLAHGGGVAGAIVRRGGRVIQDESSKKAPIKTGSATYTASGNLECKYVIHAVGPIWGEGSEEEKLRSAIKSSLKVGSELCIESISFPAISSGIFGFPKKLCAEIFIEEVSNYLTNEKDSIKLIRLCNIDSMTVKIFLDIADARFSV